LEAVECAGGAVQAVQLRMQNERRRVATSCFVAAAGPHLVEVARLLDVDLPVFCELHWKAAFRDRLGVVPREAPLLVWEDAQILEWNDEEREILDASPESRWLLGMLPAGVHCRPEGGLQQILVLWPYHAHPDPVHFPLEADPVFPEVALRGMSTMLPGLRAYWEALPRSFVDGGYYVKTRENRCLVGPLPRRGAFVMGAFAGYGLMAACGAAELLARHILGDAKPEYAPAFDLRRYDDAGYRQRLETWGSTAEL
jgi:glycine/D-amino acid oxidase-like deaminating enzyme